MDFDIDDGYFHHEDNEHDQRIAELSENKRYVPVALCLETETEYHDSFRHIMLSLFDLIRIPENLVNKIHDNRTMAFAELIAHLAFLRTIPAPPFNSIYNLFDVLDVRSIFYCWKALLFDKTVSFMTLKYFFSLWLSVVSIPYSST